MPSVAQASVAVDARFQPAAGCGWSGPSRRRRSASAIRLRLDGHQGACAWRIKVGKGPG